MRSLPVQLGVHPKNLRSQYIPSYLSARRPLFFCPLPPLLIQPFFKSERRQNQTLPQATPETPISTAQLAQTSGTRPVSYTGVPKKTMKRRKKNNLINTQATNTEREDGKVTKEDQIEKADNTGGNTEEKDEKTL